MAFKVSDIISDARSDLKDSYEGSYTYFQADMARYAGEAVVALRQVRSSTRYDPVTEELYDDDGSWLALTEDQINLAIPVEDKYRPSLAAYIIYKCMMRDVTDEGNKSVAEDAYNRFAQIAAQ